jgi:hypothetical protein
MTGVTKAVSKENNMRQVLFSAALSVGLLVAISPMPASAANWQEYRDYGRLRGLIDRTQSDLRMAADAAGMDARGRQRDRYRDAQKSLSDLDRRLSNGRFDRGQLDHSISHVKGILDHNILQARNRDALIRDLEDLRMARDHYWR